MIFANKQDLPHAVKVSDMADTLRLQSLHHPWYIQSCSAVQNYGMYEGLDWLSKTLATKHKMNNMNP